MKLQGIFAEITTPFDHKGDIYKTKVEHNVEKWNRTTLAGYVVCGRAGEGELLAAEEKSAVWEMVAKWAAPAKVLRLPTARPIWATKPRWSMCPIAVPKPSWRIFGRSPINPGFR